jgi:cyanophycinase
MSSGNGKSNGNAKAKSNGKAKHAKRARHARRGGGRGHGIVPAPIRPGDPNASVAAKGALIIIGGHEDKKHEKLILRAVADRVGSGKLVVATVASERPTELFNDYEPIFRNLGVRHVHHLNVESREEAKSEAKVRILDGADAVFFTGGDQLKLTSQLGDSPTYERLREIFFEGGLIAGTSAGASVMCETMMVAGDGNGSNRIGGHLRMAPGFGFMPGVIIDQHFAERGRIGRLVGAVAQNPRILGIGIDEDTAIVAGPKARFRVLGSGAVYVVDGQDVSYTNLSDEETDRTLSVYGIRLHVLSMGDEFDLTRRVAKSHPAQVVEEELVGKD